MNALVLKVTWFVKSSMTRIRIDPTSYNCAQKERVNLMIATKVKPLRMGTDAKTGQQILLNRDWLQTHVQMVGPPGTGKTRLLLSLFKELAAEPSATVILMNPK